MKTLLKKLHPSRFTAMSGKMAAIVGFILGQKYTDPAINQIAITSDNMVLAQHEGEVGLNDFVGAWSDFKGNWDRLLDAAGLTKKERAAATKAFDKKVRKT